MNVNTQQATLVQEGGKGSVKAQALLVVVFAGLTALGAQIELPHQPVPYTLQTFFVLLSGALLGRRNGALSQFTYLVAGAAGLPVFSALGFGAARLLGPTGGYLLSFPIAAFAVGYIIDGKPHIVRSVAAIATGLFVIFALGTVQLNFVFYHDWSKAFVNGFLIFSWWDVLKLAGAVAFVRQVGHRLERFSA